jgi:RND superfamily putative drug exporter
MTLLPAVLGLLGTKVNRIRVLPSRFLRTGENGMWHRLATSIMQRPIISGGLVLLIMLALAFPATQLAFSFGSFKNAPQVESVVGYQYMTAHFRKVSDPAQVVIQAPGSGNLLRPSQIAGMRQLENRLRKDPEVRSVYGAVDVLPSSGVAASSKLTERYISPDKSTGVISVVARHEVGTKQSEDLVRRLRTEVAPFVAGPLKGDRIYVGGSQAGFTDWNDAIYSKFPLIIAIVLALTYAFLFFAFRSVFLPLKAVLLNLLSVGASYGLLVLVFQHGVGSSLLGFSAESGVASWVPIFLFAFLFGLSMDYEVFLLSRIRERWLSTGHNKESVAFGLEKTGRLISSAAAVMVVAFTAFLIGHEIQLKEFGFGMLASIALDASLIRIVLVPSIMELMGDWNWWVPGFLQGFARSGATFGEGGPEVEEERELVSV